MRWEKIIINQCVRDRNTYMWCGGVKIRVSGACRFVRCFFKVFDGAILVVVDSGMKIDQQKGSRVERERGVARQERLSGFGDVMWVTSANVVFGDELKRMKIWSFAVSHIVIETAAFVPFFSEILSETGFEEVGAQPTNVLLRHLGCQKAG